MYSRTKVAPPLNTNVANFELHIQIHNIHTIFATRTLFNDDPAKSNHGDTLIHQNCIQDHRLNRRRVRSVDQTRNSRLPFEMKNTRLSEPIKDQQNQEISSSLFQRHERRWVRLDSIALTNAFGERNASFRILTC
jgi:hypothetical protein